MNAWLGTHPRVHIHFTPTSVSWLNLVERFFAEITDEAIRRGVFKHGRALEAAIDAYLAVRNARPSPCAWTATIDAIIEKTAGASSVLDGTRNTLAISDPIH